MWGEKSISWEDQHDQCNFIYSYTCILPTNKWTADDLNFKKMARKYWSQEVHKPVNKSKQIKQRSILMLQDVLLFITAIISKAIVKGYRR